MLHDLNLVVACFVEMWFRYLYSELNTWAPLANCQRWIRRWLQLHDPKVKSVFPFVMWNLSRAIFNSMITDFIFSYVCAWIFLDVNLVFTRLIGMNSVIEADFAWSTWSSRLNSFVSLYSSPMYELAMPLPQWIHNLEQLYAWLVHLIFMQDTLYSWTTQLYP